jgi:Putative DNA-binding protein N-terminus
VLQAPTQELGANDRLTVGVAARLSRYLQVLTQAKKMGKDRISSQEMSDYTNINATQIRRDLSAFGKFGKRGVGYNIDSLLGEIRRILGSVRRSHRRRSSRSTASTSRPSSTPTPRRWGGPSATSR